MSTITVIAARNEGDSIYAVVRGALAYGDVLVVDNASTDSTADMALRAGADVFYHEQDTHIKQSYVDGFVHVLAYYDSIVQMDAGHSHDVRDIPYLLAALEGADVAIGKRVQFIGHPCWRIAMSRAAGWLIRTLTGMPYADPTGGFRAYRADVLLELDVLGILDGLQATAHAFQFELLYHIWRCGFTVAEVPISYHGSGSSLKPWVVREAMGVLWALR